MKIIYDYFVLVTNKITILTLSIIVLVFKKYPQKIRTHYYKINTSLHLEFNKVQINLNNLFSILFKTTK